MAQYTQRTQPMHRHSKWLEKTFGDTELSSNCQIVCEEHMDPGFVMILNQRHNISNGVDAEIEDIPSEETSPSPPKVTKRKVGRPRKTTNALPNLGQRKTTKKNTAKKSKDLAKIKKKTKPRQHEPLNEPDECKEEMPELMIAENESLERMLSIEPPEKRAKLQTSPFQHDDDDTNDSITYEIVIKDDPDNLESDILLPSVICDDVDFEVKREHTEKTEVMDSEPEQDYEPEVDVKIETTDVLEEQIENILSEYKIVPPSLIDEEKPQTTHLQIPKAFVTTSELLDNLLEENLISRDQRDILAQHKVISQLFMDSTQHLNPKSKMKSFAIALYVMSHKAYDYVLRTYKTSLPPQTAVKDWLVQRKGHSGFTRETLEEINFMTKDDEGTKKFPVRICLVLKEIKLHQYIQYRAPSKRFLSVEGNTTNPLEWSLAKATSVLVFTAVAINASWKLPIGYFWDNVINTTERANLVKVAIDILETVGAVTVAISFESNNDNRRMCEELSGTHTPILNEYFMSYSGIPIFLFPDPCDILKLIDTDIRNNEYYDESHKVISLNHLSELLNYANIPSEKPVTLKKVIASQLCRKDFSSYKGHGAGTLTFLQHLQNVFDILFSRHSAQVQKLIEAGQTGKRGEDIHRHAVALREAVMYLKSLQFKDSMAPSVTLGSLMLLCTVIETALMMIYKYWRQWPISFGKFIGNSSYFLANLMPPQCNGDKNPTANTFQREYKAMLEENISKSLLRCSTKRSIEHFLLLKCNNPVDIINLTTAVPNGNKLKMIAHDFWKLLKCETYEFTDEFVVYVARFVTTILIYQLHCETCIRAIRNATINMTENQKTRPEQEKVRKKLVVTKLDEPSRDVMDICKNSEVVFKRAILHRKCSGIKLCVPVLVSKVLKKYMNRPLFVDILHHQFDTDRTCNHLIELARAVSSTFLDLRINHWKLYELNRGSKKLS